jgi:hypothetical protein
MTMPTTREQLHEMVDALPDEQFDAARHALWELSIPEDDEPVTPEDLEAIRLGREEYAQGKTISNAEMKQRLGLR